MSRFRHRSRKPARPEARDEPKMRFLVVSEGQVTEREYLKGFEAYAHNAIVELDHPSRHGVPRTVVEIAKELRDKASRDADRMEDENLKYDEVWCMYDIDEHPDPNGTRQMAIDNGLCLAVSNPCIELWLLLHFENAPGAQDRSKYLGFLRKHLRNYSGKNKHVDFAELMDGYDEAVRRARALDNVAASANSPGHNPTTGVYVLTERIRTATFPASPPECQSS